MIGLESLNSALPAGWLAVGRIVPSVPHLLHVERFTLHDSLLPAVDLVVRADV